MLEAPAHSSHALVRCDAPSSILGLIRPRPGMTACGGTSISLGARLCHLAARLAHSGGCGIRHQPRVAENRAELVSLAETSNGRLGSIGMHARDLARLINIPEAELQQLGVRSQLPFISVPPWASGFGETTAAMAAGGECLSRTLRCGQRGNGAAWSPKTTMQSRRVDME
jgi:hypothetical protein